MEPEGPLPNSQTPTICLYQERDHSSPYVSIPLLEDPFNIILLYSLRSSKWTVFLRSLHQHPLCTFWPTNVLHAPVHIIILNVIT